jgi:hypothetical protein
MVCIAHSPLALMARLMTSEILITNRIFGNEANGPWNGYMNAFNQINNCGWNDRVCSSIPSFGFFDCDKGVSIDVCDSNGQAMGQVVGSIQPILDHVPHQLRVYIKHCFHSSIKERVEHIRLWYV